MTLMKLMKIYVNFVSPVSSKVLCIVSFKIRERLFYHCQCGLVLAFVDQSTRWVRC